MEPTILPSTNASGGGESCSSRVTGTILGKFDCGYLVTVELGSETLNGVLYHPDNSGYGRDDDDDVRYACTDIVPYTGQNHQFLQSEPLTQTTQPLTQPQQYSSSGQRKKKRRRKRKGGDPNRPKTNRSGYNFFFAEKHSMLKTLYPNREREFTKMIGESWNSLSTEERTIYQNHGLKDKERYQRELREYNARLDNANRR